MPIEEINQKNMEYLQDGIVNLGKHIENNMIGKALTYVGKESFYVMALHFVGFKIGTMSLSCLGWGVNLRDLTPEVGSNVLLLLFYTAFGVGFPLVFMWVFRKIKDFILSYRINHLY